MQNHRENMAFHNLENTKIDRSSRETRKMASEAFDSGLSRWKIPIKQPSREKVENMKVAKVQNTRDKDHLSNWENSKIDGSPGKLSGDLQIAREHVAARAESPSEHRPHNEDEPNQPRDDYKLTRKPLKISMLRMDRLAAENVAKLSTTSHQEELTRKTLKNSTIRIEPLAAENVAKLSTTSSTLDGDESLQNRRGNMLHLEMDEIPSDLQRECCDTKISACGCRNSINFKTQRNLKQFKAQLPGDDFVIVRSPEALPTDVLDSPDPSDGHGEANSEIQKRTEVCVSEIDVRGTHCEDIQCDGSPSRRSRQPRRTRAEGDTGNK